MLISPRVGKSKTFKLGKESKKEEREINQQQFKVKIIQSSKKLPVFDTIKTSINKKKQGPDLEN